MKHLGRAIGGCLLVWIAASACGGSSSGGVRLGGETNWLGSCRYEADCGVGQCLCGMCTLSCDDSSACGDAPGASCVSSRELAPFCSAQLSGGGICLDPEHTPPLQATGGSLLLDTTLERMLGDLESLPAADQPYQRYVSLANLRESGSLLESELPGLSELVYRRGQEGLYETLYSLTWRVNAASQFFPRWIEADPDQLLHRIDLREFDWQHPVTVDGVPYANAWEAVAARAALALEYRGPAADRLKQLTGASVPWLFVDDLVNAATLGNTYYELLGLPDTLDGLRALLEGDSRRPQATAMRAAFDNSGVSHSPRVIERRSLSNTRSYWQVYDFASDERGAAAYSDPLGFTPDATEVMFPLPNGLFGFFLADREGRRVTESPLSPEPVADPSQRDFVMRNAASCFSCHNAGLIAFADYLRERWSPEPPAGLADLQGRVLDMYPAPEVLERIYLSEAEDYARYLSYAGVDPQAPDSVSRLSTDFRYADLTLGRAAAELMAMPATLRLRLPELPEPLRALQTDHASIPRADFIAAYRDALCALHRFSQNQPVGCEE